MTETRKRIEQLGVTKAYRAVQQAMLAAFHRRWDAVRELQQQRRQAQQDNADLDLLLDDAKFHRLPRQAIGELKQQRRPEEGYKSAIGEDWPEDF